MNKEKFNRIIKISLVAIITMASQGLVTTSLAQEKQKRPTGITWTWQLDADKNTIIFGEVKSNRSVKIIGKFTGKYSFMAEEDDAAPQILNFENKQYFLVTYWNQGKAGNIRVFNPLYSDKKSEPLCDIGTLSDSVSAKIDGNKLMVEVWDGPPNTDFAWVKCADLSLSSPAKKVDSISESSTKILKKKSIFLQYDGKNVSVPLKLGCDPHGPDGEFQVFLNTTQILDKIILISFNYYCFDSGASAAIAVNKSDLEVLWRKNLEFFNLTTPISDGTHIYLAATFVVYKVDQNGVIVWQVYDHEIENPDKLEIKGSVLSVIYNEDEGGKILKLNTANGKIIR